MNPTDPVSSSFMASVLGLTTQRLGQLVAEGILTRAGHGLYPLAASVQAYAEYKEQRAGERSSPALDALDAERTRKLKLENDETERLLFPMERLDEALDLLAGPVMVELVSLPAQATDDVRQRRKLADLVDGIRERHADRLRRVAADIRGGLDPYHDDEGEADSSEGDDDLED